jgi:hypothetical protein
VLFLLLIIQKLFVNLLSLQTVSKTDVIGLPYIVITVYSLQHILFVLLVITNTYRYVTIDLNHKMLHTEEAHDLH